MDSKLEKLKAKYLKAKNAYYNSTTGTTIMSDSDFDNLEDKIRALDPRWKGLRTTGAQVGKKTEVKLGIPMPSLSKVKPESKSVQSELGRVAGIHPKTVISAKLDGSSIQARYEGGKLVFLATRGDGETGKDISFFIPHLPDKLLPKRIKYNRTVTLRLEAVLSLKAYEKRWASTFDSARAVASAVFNRRSVHAAIKDVHLVVLRVLDQDGQHPRLSEGLKWAAEKGFEVVQHKVVSELPSVDALSKMLDSLRKKGEYEVDGLVIASDAKALKIKNEKPKWAVAFKVDDYESAPVTTIKEIIWNPSTFGVLVPKARVEPVKFGNVTVKLVALHNAKLASDNGHGVGAKVKILRSGDIIPKIVETIKRKDFKLPSKKDVGAYDWDATRTNLVLCQASGATRAKTLLRTFHALDMEFLGSSAAESLVKMGLDSPLKLFKAKNLEAKLGSAGFGKSNTAKLLEGIEKVRAGSSSIEKLAVASGAFDKGVGTTRIKTLMNTLPKLVKQVREANGRMTKEQIDKIAKTTGLGPIFAANFAAGSAEFFRFLSETGIKVKSETRKVSANGAMRGWNVSWTGYRSKEEEAWVESMGGNVVSFGSKTSVLLYTESGKTSSKLDKAREKGIPVMQFSKLKSKF